MATERNRSHRAGIDRASRARPDEGWLRDEVNSLRLDDGSKSNVAFESVLATPHVCEKRAISIDRCGLRTGG